MRFLSVEPLLEDLGEVNLEGIHWVIVGGESGRVRGRWRNWVLSIREQCQAAKRAVLLQAMGRCAEVGGGPFTGWPRLSMRCPSGSSQGGVASVTPMDDPRGKGVGGRIPPGGARRGGRAGRAVLGRLINSEMEIVEPPMARLFASFGRFTGESLPVK